MQSMNVFQLLEKSFQVGTVRNGAKVNSLGPDQTVRLRQRDAGLSAWDQNFVTVKASLKLLHSALWIQNGKRRKSDRVTSEQVH